MRGRGGLRHRATYIPISDETGGPAYALEDISATGTAVSLADNAVSAAIPIGFPFHFFNADYSSIYISSNGFLSFLSGQGNGATIQPIPTAAAPNAIIAGWWGDLKPNYGGSITYQLLGTAPNRRFVLQYKDIPYAILGTVKVSFEIKLFEADQAIEVHYASAPSYSNLNGDVFPNTAGIENDTGQLGLQYYNGVEGLPSSLAVRYTPFVGVALEPASMIGYAEAGETKTFELNVFNWTGQTDTFDLSVVPTHNDWVTRFLPEAAVTLDQGAGAAFTVEVDFPADAVPADYYAFDLIVTSRTSVPESTEYWSDTTSIIAAVPRTGYVFNQNQINFVDTQFHQDLGSPIDTTVYGQFLLSGALSQDGKQLFGLLAGATDDEGGSMTGRVLIFDTEHMDAAPAMVDVGNDASFIAETPDGKSALVTSYADGTLKVLDIDPESLNYLTVTQTITLGTKPIRIATSPCLSKAYITNNGSNSVSVVELASLNTDTPVIRTITGFNAPWGIQVAPTGDKAYVINGGNGKIGIINTINDTLTTPWSVTGSSLQDLDLSADGSFIYTAGSANVLAVNASTGSLAATIPNEASGLYSVDVFPESFGQRAYVSNGGLQTISVIDTASNAIVYSIPMPGAPSYTSLFPPNNTCAYKPIAAFSPTNAVAQLNVPFTFTNLSIRNPTSVEWNFGDGTPVSTDFNPTHTYTTKGTYTVTLMATNAYGSSTATGTINFKPKASFDPATAVINLGDPITFNNTSTGNDTLTYRWNFGDGTAVSTAVSPSHTYSAIGNYTVTLTATNSQGSDTATGLVVFYPKSVFTPKDSVIQTGDTINFVNASTGSTPLTYTWDFGDGSATSSLVSPSHVYPTAGSYTVSLKVDNTWGTSTTTGTVNFKPRAIFTPTLSKIQAGDSVPFTNTSTGTGTLTYTWNFGDGTPTSSELSPTHVYTTVGNYTVSLKVDNAYGTETATGSVVFPPIAAFTQSDDVIQTGDSVTFTNSSTGTAPLTYLWEFGDGETSTSASPVHVFTTAGAYTVKLTTTNSYGSSQATGQVNFAPKAVFTPTNPIIQLGQAINFNNGSTGTPTLSYAWEFGDGATSTSANPSHTYTTAGTYTVKLTVTNSFGSDSASGTVNFAPKAAFTPLSKVIQLGDSITFTNQSTGTPTLTYLWNFGDGNTSTLKDPSHTYAAAGSYTVSLKATNAYGNETVTGTVNFSPKTSFTPTNKVIQLGEAIAFTSSCTGTAPLTYAWDFGDGSTSSDVNPSHTYSTAGAYTVKLKVSNAYGDETSTGTVNFSPKTAFTPTNKVVRLGDAITFANSSSGTAPLTYEWDFGDGSTSSAQNPTYTYTTAGSYTVKLKVTNAYGNETATGTVNFSPKAVFTPTNKVIQLGDGITFTNSSSGTAPLTYEWDFGDGSTSILPNPSHTYAAAGSYTVQLKVTNAYGNETATGTVNFSPKVSFSPTNKVIQLGESIAFTSSSTGTAPLTYAWDFGDGATSSQPSPSHTYTTAGSYTVKLKVTNAYGNETLTGSVNFAPKADFSYSPTSNIKPGMEVAFTNNTTGTAPITCTWDFGDGSPTSSAQNPKHTYSSRAVFTVILACHSDAYGDDSIQKNLEVAPYRVMLTLLNDDGVDTVDAGAAITYQIEVSNGGPDDLIGATVSDDMPDWLEEVSWTCSASSGSTCAASGTGNLIQEVVDIRSGGSLTYTVQAVVKPGAVGPLTNTVSLILPSIYLNTNPDGDSTVHTTIVIGKLFLPLIER